MNRCQRHMSHAIPIVFPPPVLDRHLQNAARSFYRRTLIAAILNAAGCALPVVQFGTSAGEQVSTDAIGDRDALARYGPSHRRVVKQHEMVAGLSDIVMWWEKFPIFPRRDAASKPGCARFPRTATIRVVARAKSCRFTRCSSSYRRSVSTTWRTQAHSAISRRSSLRLRERRTCRRTRTECGSTSLRSSGRTGQSADIANGPAVTSARSTAGRQSIPIAGPLPRQRSADREVADAKRVLLFCSGARVS
jgi:hypothetical protein